uniref:Uncharacterized protein n=1 Tax=Acrobeloides nanus TaxID=290746 RepID=A0A914CCZ0_9BILA
MDILTRLNALMKEAFEEHEACLKAMNEAPKYESTEFEPLNDLLNEWKDNDDEPSDNDFFPNTNMESARVDADTSNQVPTEPTINRREDKRAGQIFFI